MATSQIREEALQLTEMRLVLLGKRGAGKTAAGNTIFGREEFRREGESCVKRRAEVAGRQVIVVDTPGWDRVNVQRTSDQTKEELKRSVLLCPPGPHALLLVIPLEEFPERENKAVNKHMHFLGDRAWRHTIVLLTCDDELRGTTVEEHIAKEKHLQRLVEKCGNRYRFLSNVSGCPRTQVTELLGKIEEMVVENGGEFYIPQVYYDIIESRTPKEYTDMRREHEEKVWLLKERWRKREEQLKKENEELKKQNKELYKGESESRGLRKRRSSLENPPNLAGERTEEEERQQKEEKEGTGQRIDPDAIRLGYRDAGMALIQHYIKPAAVILSAIVGALIGAIAGAHRGTMGAALGVPIGVGIALLLAALIRQEARAARGTTPFLRAEDSRTQSHQRLQQQTSSPSLAHS